jgi:hypothetical protein
MADQEFLDQLRADFEARLSEAAEPTQGEQPRRWRRFLLPSERIFERDMTDHEAAIVQGVLERFAESTRTAADPVTLRRAVEREGVEQLSYIDYAKVVRVGISAFEDDVLTRGDVIEAVKVMQEAIRLEHEKQLKRASE